MSVEYDRIYRAYKNCLKHKASSPSALQFSAGELVLNLQDIVDDINNRTYIHGKSSCFGVTYPTPREIYAAQFRDRTIQHFYIEEIESIIEDTLIETTTSCRKNKGVDFALLKLHDFLIEESGQGTKNCFFLKIDLSGYFMSIRRKQLSQLMQDLINEKYTGKYKEELLYLTPIIYENNPAKNRVMRMAQETWDSIPERKRMKIDSNTGLAIGNITAQYGSNMNLNSFDHYIVEELGFNKYVRYVDDIIILNENKQQLINVLPNIENKLKENGHTINQHKTIIDTAYHGVPFLGKMSYPYGYQKPTKASAGRMMKAAHDIRPNKNLLSQLNSQAGRFRHYATHNLMASFIKNLSEEVWDHVDFVEEKQKFILKEQ